MYLGVGGGGDKDQDQDEGGDEEGDGEEEEGTEEVSHRILLAMLYFVVAGMLRILDC